MDLGIKDKVALVTGSARGIGEATLRMLAREGAKVVVSDIDAAAVEETTRRFQAEGFDAIGATCDVCVETQVKAVVMKGAAKRPAELSSPVIDFSALGSSDADTLDEGESPEVEIIVFTTSGTTRSPKLVTHTQQGVVTHGHNVARALGLEQPGSVLLQLYPFGGVMGFTQMVAGIAIGCPAVICSGFHPDKVIAAMLRYRVTNFTATDEIMKHLVDENSPKVAFPDLRFIGYGSYDGSPIELPRDVLEPHGIECRGTYGMSEIFANASFQAGDAPLEERVQGGGHLLGEGAQVRVRDADSGELLGHGVVGEMEFKCPSIMSRYMGDEAATAKVFTEDGFFKSGDAGVTNPDGSFRLIGRMGDAMRLGGYLVNPLEISEFVASHPAVAECQVVAAQTEGGMRPVAFVVLQPGSTFDESELFEHCNGGLAKYKRPVKFLPIDAIPATPGANGVKVQKEKLRQLAKEAL